MLGIPDYGKLEFEVKNPFDRPSMSELDEDFDYNHCECWKPDVATKRLTPVVIATPSIRADSRKENRVDAGSPRTSNMQPFAPNVNKTIPVRGSSMAASTSKNDVTPRMVSGNGDITLSRHMAED